MATSYDTYKKQYLKDTNADKIVDINAVRNQGEQQRQAITESYDTQIADTQASYENAFRQNEVQRVLNERFLERKAAEMGLTDSGMNRTQQTANQLSYGNQKAALTAQKQKAIDTLAAAMRAKITDIKTAEDAQVRAIEKQYDANADAYALNRHNADVEAEKEKYKAQVEAENNVYHMSDSEMERFMEYIEYGEYEKAEHYLEIMRGKGMSEEQVGRWAQMIPDSYWFPDQADEPKAESTAKKNTEQSDDKKEASGFGAWFKNFMGAFGNQ